LEELMADILHAFREDHEQALTESIQGLLSRHLPNDRAGEADRDRVFLRDVWETLGENGMLGLGMPEEQGGSGGGVAESTIVTRELARVLPSMAVDYVLCGMVGRTIIDSGQHRDLIPGLASGERIYSYALSEPGGGSDLLSLRTQAKLEGDSWRINGSKLWISLAHESDLIFVLARTDEPEPGRSRASGLSLLVVPKDQPGIQINKVNLAIMRAAGTCEIFFTDALAPASAIVGERGRGLHALRGTLDVERVLSAAISLGIGHGALDLALRYVCEREAFGGPIGRFQSVQHPLAESAAELTAASLLVEHAARSIDAGLPASQESAMAKLVASECVGRLVDRASRAMGAMGMAEESGMQRYVRDARLQLFSPVNNDLVRSIVAQGLGLPRSY
jgi:alkylation response protein AidB-like acyl-CoA dehydrogenase